MNEVTRLVATEHVRNKYSLRESKHSKSVNLLIVSNYLQSHFKLHLLRPINQLDFIEEKVDLYLISKNININQHPSKCNPL